MSLTLKSDNFMKMGLSNTMLYFIQKIDKNLYKCCGTPTRWCNHCISKSISHKSTYYILNQLLTLQHTFDEGIMTMLVALMSQNKCQLFLSQRAFFCGCWMRKENAASFLKLHFWVPSSSCSEHFDFRRLPLSIILFFITWNVRKCRSAILYSVAFSGHQC